MQFNYLKFFIIIIILHLTTSDDFEDDVEEVKDIIVTLNHGGKISGEEKKLWIFSSKKYYSFKGIPYAMPPVKELRLRNPKPHPGWNGTRSAKEHGNICISYNFLELWMQGDEDCLFLNVYSPADLNPKEKYAVMFYIHGGSFNAGSGNSFIYGPNHLVNEDIILVTINYRLGFFGFFSTNDKYAQGNYGIKDCVEALKWVQNNIEVFGGDKNKVTIFGESAGGCIVHYLLLSSMAKGLFHRAITQSGSALLPWAFQDDPGTQAKIVAKELKLEYNSTEDLVRQLRDFKDAKTLAKTSPTTGKIRIARGNGPFRYSPSIEPEDSEEPRFLTKTPLHILNEGNFRDVPYIIGNTNREALYVVRETLETPNILEILSNDSNLLLPYEWHIKRDSKAAQDIVSNIRKIYFKGKPTITDMEDYVDYATDRHFLYGIYKTVGLHSKKQKQPLFYYIFTFDGAFNYVKKLLLLWTYCGAMHGDDLGYLFKIANIPFVKWPILDAQHLRSQMVKMWSDFSKSGNPTPDMTELINVKWVKVDGNHEYLDIGSNLEVKQKPNKLKMEMWEEMDKKYSNAV